MRDYRRCGLCGVQIGPGHADTKPEKLGSKIVCKACYKAVNGGMRYLGTNANHLDKFIDNRGKIIYKNQIEARV